ncbi:lipase family alpha/beta hydrolase [Brytella acorum]|uniref:Alpha/beta hydrolase n=1 Tax=Brytella acorum TaxID=2959299 RepID=A0AA35UUP6_9PROT|nr:alpha/beta fold hydrolase [Brytella acorum]MDF3623569.1 alpha/beta hydrolase [Brytella acorum]CAI9120013.1 alpha/beta hydrolase [Brytella acorum]
MTRAIRTQGWIQFFHRAASVTGAGFLTLATAGCTNPVWLERMSLIDAYQSRSASALSGSGLSNSTRIVLESQNLRGLWSRAPRSAIARLRVATQEQFYTPDLKNQLFALAELSYLEARRSHDRSMFMSAALYAYAFLAPFSDPSQRPSAYDPHFRQACDIYMFALTEAFGSPVDVRSQHWILPFGSLALTSNPLELSWQGHVLTDFRPTSRLSVHGMNNVYSSPGLGEPLAALPKMDREEEGTFELSRNERVPFNLFLNISDPQRQVLSDHIEGQIVVTPMNGHPPIDDKTPLQYDQTAARAITLNETDVWSSEYRGFLNGQFFETPVHGLQLSAMQPHQDGHMPVIFVHGTASSPARWADMVNELLEDPDIRAHYEFWFFSYATGNPIPYSALELRRSIGTAIANLGGVEADPALGRITLVGHSQGGLLSKMLVIDPRDRLWNGMVHVPLDRLHLTPDARSTLSEMLFPTPMPQIRSVVYIATPQHGSYVAALSISKLVGRLVTFPLGVTDVVQQVLTGNAALTKINMRPWRLGSVYGMSPRSAFIRALAATPMVPDVQAHSIIPVLGDGPLNRADDGVVTYESAHIPDVRSELVVRHSGHSTQSNPVTIAEVRRILLDQIAQVTADPVERGDRRKSGIVRIGGRYTPLATSSP